MRISDWSSDVCSSDLGRNAAEAAQSAAATAFPSNFNMTNRLLEAIARLRRPGWPCLPRLRHMDIICGQNMVMGRTYIRSEEHTSELQSLMRISYAVFCLKKKNNTKNK